MPTKYCSPSPVVVMLILLPTHLLLQIVELLNIIYCLAELLEFAAFLRLRITAPDMKR